MAFLAADYYFARNPHSKFLDNAPKYGGNAAGWLFRGADDQIRRKWRRRGRYAGQLYHDQYQPTARGRAIRHTTRPGYQRFYRGYRGHSFRRTRWYGARARRFTRNPRSALSAAVSSRDFRKVRSMGPRAFRRRR